MADRYNAPSGISTSFIGFDTVAISSGNNEDNVHFSSNESSTSNSVTDLSNNIDQLVVNSSSSGNNHENESLPPNSINNLSNTFNHMNISPTTSFLSNLSKINIRVYNLDGKIYNGQMKINSKTTIRDLIHILINSFYCSYSPVGMHPYGLIGRDIKSNTLLSKYPNAFKGDTLILHNCGSLTPSPYKLYKIY